MWITDTRIYLAACVEDEILLHMVTAPKTVLLSITDTQARAQQWTGKSRLKGITQI